MQPKSDAEDKSLRQNWRRNVPREFKERTRKRKIPEGYVRLKDDDQGGEEKDDDQAES